MKRITLLLALTLVVALTVPAVAEVEEITVGGSIIVQGEYQEPGFGTASAAVDQNGTLDAGLTPASLADIFLVTQPTGVDEDITSQAWYSQRTRVNVDATLSGGVRAFVELQAYDFWGDDLDDSLGSESSTEAGNDEVALYQAFIDMNNIADYPVMLRLGRQELVYGREWLLGNNDAGSNFSGLSFDAIKLVYTDEVFQVDAWASKQIDLNSTLIPATVQDDDTDFYGIYGSYTGIENTVIDGYGMLIRNALSGGDVDYLYTIGARAAGTWDVMGNLPGLLDYNVELAYQFGDTNAGGDYEAWALNAMAGYTFTDVQWTPRLELEYAYFSGDDDILDNDTESFSRLFSDVHYGDLELGGTLDAAATNLHIFRIGGSAVPVEKLTVSADFLIYVLAEEDGLAFGNQQLGAVMGTVPAAVPVVGGATLFAAGDDDDAGYELDIAASYQYTEDLNLTVGWAHFFVGDAMENAYGGGTNDDDIDYLYVQAALDF
jgi:hypothetical protein